MNINEKDRTHCVCVNPRSFHRRVLGADINIWYSPSPKLDDWNEIIRPQTHTCILLSWYHFISTKCWELFWYDAFPCVVVLKAVSLVSLQVFGKWMWACFISKNRSERWTKTSWSNSLMAVIHSGISSIAWREIGISVSFTVVSFRYSRHSLIQNDRNEGMKYAVIYIYIHKYMFRN